MGDSGASVASARSKFGKSAKVQRGNDLTGMAKYSALYKKLPKLSSTEKRLESFGVEIPHWAMYRSLSRLKCIPQSNRCHWFGVPDRLEMGWHYADQLVSPSTKNMITPGNCDIYDIFVHQLAAHTNTTSGLLQNRSINMGSNWQKMVDIVYGLEDYSDIYGVAQTTAALNTQLPDWVLKYNRGLNYRQNVLTKIENVGNLEAFVDQYELIFEPLKRSDWTSDIYYTVDYNANVPTYFGGGAALRTPLTDPQYGHDLAGHMLMTYANEVMKARGQQIGLDNAHNLQAVEYTQVPIHDPYTTDSEKSLATLNMIERLFCSTKNDPLEAWPRGVKNHSGFSLRKVGKRHKILPAQSICISHNTRGVWNYFESPRGKQRFSKQYSPLNEITRPVGKLSIMFYRFHGDMIQSFVAGMQDAPGNSGIKNSDFQTGSCSLLFQTERTMQTRLHAQNNAMCVPFVMPFDTATVDFDKQYHVDHDGNFDKVAADLVA